MGAPHIGGASVQRIRINVPVGAYTFEVGPELLKTLSKRLESLTSGPISQTFVITSPDIWRIWSESFLGSFAGGPAPIPLFVNGGETQKRLASVERLAEQLHGAGADRNSLLLAFGGGVVGDITGFLAAIYMRGISYVQIPTTLLAQVDSSVGGKTGVNLCAGKNLIGSFHHPLAVLADTTTLSTLPPRELRAGMQEVVKAAIIRSPQLFAYLDRNRDALLNPVHLQHHTAITRVVVSSVRIKAAVVAADERESGVRMILNFGHTIGHAIEAETGYSQLLHGEAVAWGSVAATHLSLARGTLSKKDGGRIEQAILRYGPLPRFGSTATRLVELTTGDKKRRSGTRAFVVPTGIGKVEVVRDVTDAELVAATDSMLSLMRERGTGEV